MYPNPYSSNAYAQASKNVSPMRAIIMLYEGAVRLIGEARRADEEGDYEGRFNAVDKASKIILGLQGQLDFENGGDISPMLHEFYDNLFMRMMQINSRNPGPVIDDVLASLNQMKETWIEVAKQTEGSKGTPHSSTDPTTQGTSKNNSTSMPSSLSV